TKTFEPLLTQLVNTLASQLDERTRRFANGLERVRMDMAADAPVVISKEVARQDKISIGERVLAAAGGLLVGDVATATIGATFGFNEMLKSIIPQLAITVVTVALVGWNPFILIPAMLFGGG